MTDELQPLSLPDQGRNWRWLGGVAPPICELCLFEPGVARYSSNRPTNGGKVVGWGCLRVLDRKDRRGGDEDEGGGEGGVREPRDKPPTPSPLSAEVEL